MSGDTVPDRHEILRAAREAAGLNQQEVGLLIAPFYGRVLRDTEISRLERGDRPVSERVVRAYERARVLTREQAVDMLLGPEAAA